MQDIDYTKEPESIQSRQAVFQERLGIINNNIEKLGALMGKQFNNISPMEKYSREMLDKAYKQFSKGKLSKDNFDDTSKKYNKIMVFDETLRKMRLKSIDEITKMMKSGVYAEIDFREDIEQKILSALQANEELFRLNKTQIKEYISGLL